MSDRSHTSTPVVLLDFTKREVRRISQDEARAMMRDQETRGVKIGTSAVIVTWRANG